MQLTRIATQIWYLNDLEAAKTWFKHILQLEPYFDHERYVGYEISGLELGLYRVNTPLIQSRPTCYWQVANLAQCLSELAQRGAQMGDAVEDVGEGILMASIIGPEGNHLGLIENPHLHD